MGLNFLIAGDVCDKARQVKFFKYTNIFAGTLTFSSTFILFFLLYLIVKLLRSKRFVKVAIITIPFILVVCVGYIYIQLMDPNWGKFTSVSDRLVRLEIAYNIISQSNALNLLFGSGIGASTEMYGKGISSGILSVLVERGIAIFIFLGYVLVKFTWHNKVLLLFIIFYHLAFELFWHPAFLVAVALSFVVAKKHDLSDKIAESGLLGKAIACQAVSKKEQVKL